MRVLPPARHRGPTTRRPHLRRVGVQAGLRARLQNQFGALGVIRVAPPPGRPAQRSRLAQTTTGVQLTLLSESIHRAHRLHFE